MIACILCFTACSDPVYEGYERTKTNDAMNYAKEEIVTWLERISTQELINEFSDYTNEEIEYYIEDEFGIEVEGGAMDSILNSFNSAAGKVGKIVSIDNVKVKIDRLQIIVTMDVECEKGTAEAEVVLSNDRFKVLEGAALNPTADFFSLLGKAGLNTLLGMGTVFVVLILISLIISLFKFIPVIQQKFTKKDKEEITNAGIDNAVAQIVGQEEVTDGAEELEIVAVIAAAIAAYEGSESTDGFVVRSIRKRVR